MALARSAARGAVTTLAGQGIRFCLQIASVSVLARLLSPTDYGLFAMVMAIVGLALVLGDFGLSMASIQAQDLTDTQRTNMFWTNVMLGGLLTVAVYFSAPLIASFYDRAELTEITQVVSSVFLINAIGAQFRAEVSRGLRFKALAFADVGGQTIGLVVAIAAAFAGAGYWALVYQQIATASCTTAVLVVASRWWPGLPKRGTSMRRLYGYGANTLGVQVINYVVSNADNVSVGKLLGSSELGVYARSYQLFRLPLQQIAAPLTRVALPVLSKIHDDDDRFNRYIARCQLLLTYTLVALFFGLAGFSSPIVDIALGDQWGATKPLFCLLALGGAFQALGYVYYWIFLAKGLTGLQLRFTVVGRGVTVAAMVLATIQWGAVGTAAAVAGGQVFMYLVFSVLALPRTGVPVRPMMVQAAMPLSLLALLSGILIVISYAALPDVSTWVQLCVLSLVSATYFAVTWLVAARVRRDVRMLVEVVGQLRGERTR